MKKILFPKESTKEIIFTDVDECRPIFAKRHNKLIGMVVYESDHGWIVKIGKDCGAYGFSKTLRGCIEKGMNSHYEFFVENCQ